MSWIPQWIKGKITNMTNGAAQSLLQNILKDFIDPSSFEDSHISVELFNDWSVTISLNSIFLNCSMVNSYIHNSVFQSVYISKSDFTAEINLSKINLNIARLVIEVDLCAIFQNKMKPPEIPLRLSQSISDFRQQMPIKSDVSLKNWILHCVEDVHLNIDYLTIILTIHPKFEPINITFEKLSFSVDHTLTDFISGKIFKVFGTIGHNLKKEIFNSHNLICYFSDEQVTLKFPESSFFLYKDFINILAHIYFFISELPSKSDIKISLQFNLIKGSTSLNHSFLAHNADIIVDNDNINVSIKGIQINHKNDLLLKTNESINISVSNLSKKITNDSETNERIIPDSPLTFLELSNTIFEDPSIISIHTFLPKIELNLTQENLIESIQLGLWFLAFSRDLPDGIAFNMQPSNEEEFNCMIHFNDMIFKIYDINFFALINCFKDNEIAIVLHLINYEIYQKSDFIFLRSIQSSSDFFLSYADSPNPISFVSFLMTNSLISCPFVLPTQNSLNDYQFLLDFIVLLQTVINSVPSKFENSFLKMHIEGSNIFADYVSLSTPFRAISSIDFISGDIEIDDKKNFKFSFDTKMNLYISNMRVPLPISIFMKPHTIFTSYDFSQILSLDIKSFNFQNQELPHRLTIEHLHSYVMFCPDSLTLIISLFSNHNQIQPTFSSEHLREDLQDHFNSDENPVSIDEEIPSLPLTEEKPRMHIFSDDISINILANSGRDLTELFDLRVIKQQLIFVNDLIENDFEIIPPRNESQSIEANITLSFNCLLYQSMSRIEVEVPIFDVIDHLSQSPARLMFGLENGSAKFSGDFFNDGNKNRLIIELPNIGACITQPQIEFLANYLDTNDFLIIPSSQISSDPIFDFIAIKAGYATVTAHFKFFLAVSLEDVKFPLGNNIIHDQPFYESLVSYFLDSFSKMGFLSIVSGLPVFSSISKIGKSIKSIFTVDKQRFGAGKGFLHGCGTLLKTIATETLNAGVCASSVASKIIDYTVEGIGGKDYREKGFKTALATLIVESKSKYDEKGVVAAGGEFLKQIPRVILSPGIVLLNETSNLLQTAKDHVNPELRKEMKYNKRVQTLNDSK